MNFLLGHQRGHRPVDASILGFLTSVEHGPKEQVSGKERVALSRLAEERLLRKRLRETVGVLGRRRRGSVVTFRFLAS